MPRTTLVVLVAVFIATAAFAQVTVDGEFSRDPIGVKSYPSAPRVAERAAIEPAVTVAPASVADVDKVLELQQWNDADRLPLKNGFTRSIGDPIAVRLEGALAAKAGSVASHARGLVSATERGTLIWSGSVRVEQAHRVRLHLSNVQLPDGAVLWVYGSDQQQPVGFDRDLLYDGNLYTPSVNGPVVHLEIEIPRPKTPADVASFEIKDFIEIFPTGSLKSFDPVAQDSPSCLVDATCVATSTFDSIAAARGGVAHIQYVKGAGSFVCSGGLLNDTVTSSFIPYFLTANHCLNDQASATSIEAYFDYKTSSCGGTFPPFPTSNNGSTYLASSAASDFTLLRLNSVPGGRFFLGWTTDPAKSANGSKVHRVSHPFPDAFSVPAPQAYSNTNVNTTFGTCTGVPQTNFLYSNLGQGGTYGGSSGSPAIAAGGYVVGQLLGACGTNPSAGCDNISNATVDGKFISTYPLISSYLNPGTTAGCTPSGTALCLNSDRFKVEATWQSNSASGTANVVELTADTGYLWFFSSTNVEAVVKIVNGCGLNSRYWVFAAGLTDTRVQITVTDTKNGSVKTYTNPLGTAFAPIQDTSAFATCP